ncbi:MAG: bifunctional folylpolyglutamate synthase/dihydrofolate synthase, partial [Bacteroidaceae bacterium]|nr:bifunctional folylpolyglutamate synthase/dihydrofolate synthase [Bacteroidaceae bacterium]
MDYQQTIDYLYNTTPMFRNIGASAYKNNLHNTHALDDHLNHPHTAYKTIHVAGTNGKGSCSSMLASYLQGLGYKVGLYTSPHIYSFRERIRVNGEMIPEEQVVCFVQEHRQFFEPLQPSFFELTTAMAFDYFRNAAVDIAVIEVGLGGLLDCTNIITPLLSVITNISHDHTALLGKTLSQIARQKAGIIKPNVPVIIGETTPQTKPIFLEVARQNNAPIQFAQQDTSIAEIKPYIHHCELKADYQKHNIRTVFTATKLFPTLGLRDDISIFKDSLTKISQRTGLIGRWQKVASKPDIIIDTAHNKAGWKYLSRMLNRLIATL